MLQKRTFQSLVITLTLVLVTMLIGLRPGTSVRAAAIKIMPLGDSITGGSGCWRSILWNRLQDTGYTNIDFVGSLSGQACPLLFDSDNEGHGGVGVINMANQDQLPPWLAAANPDIVLMHLGTNDLFSTTIVINDVLAAYTKLIGQMRANNPNMTIIVAQIIPMYTATGSCSICYQNVINLNAAIPAWASGLSTTQSRILIVDQWTGFDTTTDTGDGIHPNDIGFQKMSDKWYPVLTSVLSGSIPTNTPITPVAATVTRTSTPTNTPVTPTGATATRTRTATTGPSPTRTRTPTSGPTSTRTNTPSTVVAATATKTSTPVTPVAATATPTPVTPTVGACTPVTSTITAPFTYDGAGTFCWQSSNLGSYINSWNTISVTLNGVNVTNIWMGSGSYPAQIGGYWYVSYNSSVAWGHFEAK